MSEFDPDSFLAEIKAAETASPATETPQVASSNISGLEPEAFDPDQALKDLEQEKYGTPGQQAITAVEGLAKGVAGPVSTFVEKEVLGVPEEDISGREKANPVTAGVSEAAGLVGSTVAGVGLGSVMTKAGRIAQGVTKAGEAVNVAREGALALGKGAKAAEEAAELAFKAQPVIARTGSMAVQQAAEMAVIQSGNEIHKMILNDPETSAESAIANIGLAAALGGGTGAFVTGAISPLWSATAAKPLEKTLGTLKNHLDGNGRAVPEVLTEAENLLGVQMPATIKGAQTSTSARQMYGDLSRIENVKLLDEKFAFQKQISDKVAQDFGTTVDDIANYSKLEDGNVTRDIFTKEAKTKYEPFNGKFSKIEAEEDKLFAPDNMKLSAWESLTNKGLKDFTATSEYQKIFSKYGDEILAQDTVLGLRKVGSEVGGKLRAAYRNGDTNEINVYRSIKETIDELQDKVVVSEGKQLEKMGVEGAEKMSSDFLNERADLMRQYAEYKKMMRELSEFMGVREPTGGKGFENLLNRISSEDLMKKLSYKGDMAFNGFLGKYFPETLTTVKQNELKEFLKPAVLKAKNGDVIDINALAKIIDKQKAGGADYVKSILPEETLKRIEAAKTLLDAIPTPRDSGTTAGILRNIMGMPAAAMAVVAGFASNAPVLGGLAGGLAGYVGKTAPEEIKLALLRFAASDAPVKAEGFKAMVDFMSSVVKGEHMLNKGTKAIFKAGAQVTAERSMPAKADNDRLDKLVTEFRDNPESLLKKTAGQTGHYLPGHHTGLTKATATAMQYLETIKPKPFKAGPLDKEIQPSPGEQARYQRALTIANSPISVLSHVKDGTLQPSDIQDLKAMYPSLYANMAQKMSNELINAQSNEEAIPYVSRMGISLFLGQAIDSSMTPASIMAAQPKQPRVPAGQEQGPPQPKGTSTKNLGKSNSNYMTPIQSSEAHKMTRK